MLLKASEFERLSWNWATLNKQKPYFPCIPKGQWSDNLFAMLDKLMQEIMNQDEALLYSTTNNTVLRIVHALVKAKVQKANVNEAI